MGRMVKKMLNLIIAVIAVLPIAIWENFATYQTMSCIYLFWIGLNTQK